MAEQRQKLRPRCGDSRCGDNLHCYHQAQRRAKRASRSSGASTGAVEASSSAVAHVAQDTAAGSCQACGAILVDWNRVRRCDLHDVAHTFDQLKTELIRHHEFHAEIHQHAVNYARRKGRFRLRTTIIEHIRSALGPATPFHDGWQTRYPDAEKPQGKDIIYAGQHATASCCRKCAETWHGMSQGRDLTDAEILYLSELVLRFVDARLPDLADEPTHVPALRSSSGGRSKATPSSLPQT